VAKGKAPTCVVHCQAAVMTYGPVDELSSKLDDKGKQILIVK
jgi:anaerobic dimethyl sulfoxide reductase subunit B (iron-sulfur subunit)